MNQNKWNSFNCCYCECFLIAIFNLCFPCNYEKLAMTHGKQCGRKAETFSHVLNKLHKYIIHRYICTNIFSYTNICNYLCFTNMNNCLAWLRCSQRLWVLTDMEISCRRHYSFDKTQKGDMVLSIKCNCWVYVCRY